jgi:acid phosphatase
VAFYKPIGTLNEHPGYAEIMSGDAHIDDLLNKIEKSPIWNSSIIIITYDEHGGYWDHVPPPKVDRWGPGLRVPTMLISPFAKKGFVDHTVYDTTSILKLIEQRFHLATLGTRDRDAGDLTNALQF